MRVTLVLISAALLAAAGCASTPAAHQPKPAPRSPGAGPAGATGHVAGQPASPVTPLPAQAPAQGTVGRTSASGSPPCALGKQPGPNGLCSELPLEAARDTKGDQKPDTAASAPVASGVRLARGTKTPGDEQLMLGDRAYVEDDLSAAKRHYQKALTLAPRDPAPRVGLVRVALLQSGIETGYSSAPNNPQVKRWLSELDQALELDASFAPALIERGRLLLILGQAQKALSSLQAGVAKQPRDPEAQSALGVALLATGDAEAALRRFEQAQKLEPNNAERLANLGTAYMMRGRVDDAVRAYKQAVALAPSDPRAHGDLGTAYLAQHRVLQALPYLKRAVKLAPERATFLSNLGYAYQQSGKTEEAVKTYRLALQKDPRLGSAWINLATALAEQRNFEESKRALQQALAIDPTDPRAKANMQELEALMRAESAE